MSSMNEPLPLSARIEALLFAEGGSLSRKKILQILECSESELDAGVVELSGNRSGSGISVIHTDSEIALTVAPAAATTIEKAFEREVGKDIGDAGLEVLAVILYRGPSTRSQIDYIRGVNTSTTIRSLTTRGLVERIANPHDAREYLYRITPELLAYLGVTTQQELPDYATIASELATFEAEQKNPFESTHDTNRGSDTHTG
jgi:segregation and condensation protein B